MYGRIVKSEHILTKLCVLDYEYICDRKCYVLHELLIFKCWRQNISVSNIALHIAVRWDLACKKGKRGGTSEGRVENGKMDVWCEVTR